MNYTIILNNKEEIKISEEEYQKIIPFLNKVKLFRLTNGAVINAAYIMEIKPEQSPLIPLERRIQAPIIKEEKRINVPGGWQKPEMRERMKQWFNSLKKTAGCFKNFSSYEDWEKKTYPAVKKV